MIIAIVNRSERYKKNSGIVKLMSSAVDIQLSKHVSSYWGLGNNRCIYYEEESRVPSGAGKIYLVDNTSEVEGEHGQDRLGNSVGYVFVNMIIGGGGTDLIGDRSVSSTLSHEACEMVGNPEVNRWRWMGGGKLTAEEMSDAVESDYYNISVGGRQVAVSNFLLPSWFDAAPVSGSKYDYMGKLRGPFTVSEGGYMVVMSGGVMSYVFGSKKAAEKFAKNPVKGYDISRLGLIKSKNKLSGPDLVAVGEAVKILGEEKVEANKVVVREEGKASRAFDKLVPGRFGGEDVV